MADRGRGHRGRGRGGGRGQRPYNRSAPNPSHSSSSSAHSDTNIARSHKLYNPPSYRHHHPETSNSNPNTSSTPRMNSYTKKTMPTNSDSDVISTNTTSSRSNDDADFPTLVGTCPYMCPVEEMARRERLRDLAVFERLHGSPVKTSPTLAVKKFCRTISTKDVRASDVRPVPVLEDTLNYLFNLLLSSDHPFEVVHDFIFDRTRSIRQDLSMQNVVSDQVIHMYEKMVKFHIMSHHHLHQSCENPNTASMCHLNLEQLVKALTTLFDLYEASRALRSIGKNEAEFFSFYLLLHLGLDKQVEPLSLWFRRIPSLIMKSKEMCFARRILRYYRLGNYKRFIYTTEEEASYWQYCILEPYINEVRILALSCVCYGGYKLQPYPLAYLSKLLMMKESDIESLCTDRALETSDDEAGKGLVATKQSVPSKPTRGFQKYYPIDSGRIERLFAELPEL